MAETNTCPKCGAEVPADAPAGICPKCLMAAGLVSDSKSQSHPPEGSSPTHARKSADFLPPEPESLAERFPQLEILELVGKGGMGAVYKARQKELDRPVAVKILPPAVGQDPAFAERFTREARALAKLNHQNIVQVYEFGRNDDFFYFIMEFVDGANLRHTIHSGNLAPEEALAIVPQICEALQFAHNEGIVHRDIKPENVLIDKRGRVKIADFGLAKLLGQAPAEFRLTGTDQVMGTLHYMAPEQTQGSRAVDHRADIYSLGVVFYEMLTGELPIGRFEPPSKKVQLDVRLDEVVLRALESEPEKRYQQANEVKTDVEALAGKPAPEAAREPVINKAPSAEVNIETARQEVKVPAIGLMVFGFLPCLMAGVPMFMFLALARDQTTGSPNMQGTVTVRPYESPPAAAPTSETDAAQTSSGTAPPSEKRPQAASGSWRVSILNVIGIAIVLLSLAFFAIGILIVWGAWKMMHLQSYGLAMTASILALFPCHPLYLVTLGFGIWSLLVLNRPHVKAAFLHVADSPNT